MSSTNYTAAFVYQVIVVIALLLLLLILFWKRIGVERKKRKAAERQIRELNFQIKTLEVEGLRHKLNPHLFKNALNSIQSHAYQTYHAMDKLAEVLDYVLYESDHQFISVNKELQFARSLIEVNKIKISPLFDLRVKVKRSEEDSINAEPLLIPMVSAGLIENAFKHADLQSEDAFINIDMECRGGLLRIYVANKASSKPRLKKEHSGIGDVSLQKRLEVVYGNGFDIERTLKDNVYAVTLKIDLLGYKNKMHTDR